jgi:hypothetical protein
MKKALRLGLLLLLAAGPCTTHAARLLVPNVYSTIGLALQSAQDGDVISVWMHQGRAHMDTFRENVVCSTAVQIVARCYEQQVPGYPPADTYIHIQPTTPQTPGPVVRIVNVPSSSYPCILRGFTIENGNNPWNNGGGVYCDNNSGNVSIEQNRIVHNRTDSSGGGIFVGISTSPPGHVRVSHNEVDSNYAPNGEGGGIA